MKRGVVSESQYRSRTSEETVVKRKFITEIKCFFKDLLQLDIRIHRYSKLEAIGDGEVI